MRSIHPTFPAMLLLLAATVAQAQVVCPANFPAQSPVASNSPDDIPATRRCLKLDHHRAVLMEPAPRRISTKAMP